MNAAQVLDFGSVFIFALTGALVASRAQLDIVGFLFVACITAVGGGTIRDVILDRTPVFWVGNAAYVGVACLAAILVFFAAPHVLSRYRAILWLDALALAVAVPAGVLVAWNMGATPPIVVIMGVVTGCLGGLMRDVVCNEVPLVLRQGELYVTAAFAGAIGAVAALEAFDATYPALVTCGGVTLALRAGSLAFGWRLPNYRSRPPRK